MAAGKRDKTTIVIRREEEGEGGGHHGGAWKVAYADFVTAMMAFFLLMWLLNATTKEQRQGLADYFSPNAVLARHRSGFGKPFGGTTANVDGSLVSDKGAVQVVQARPRPYVNAANEGDGPPAEQATAGTTPKPGPGDQRGHAAHPHREPPRPSPTAGRAASAPPPTPPSGPASQAAAAKERAAFQQAAEQIRTLVKADPALAGLARHLAIDITPKGLRVQVMDSEKRAMFATGSAAPNDWARALLTKVMPVLMRLPEQISIAGYTDAQPYRGGTKTNWDLSLERANATRRILAEAGLPDARLQNVTGYSDRDLLLPADPLAAANRRITIVLLRKVPLPAPAAAATPASAPTVAADSLEH